MLSSRSAAPRVTPAPRKASGARPGCAVVIGSNGSPREPGSLLRFLAGGSIGGERGDERLLRHVHPADGLHPLLPLLLLLQQLALARDVAAVALGEHVLADRTHCLPGDDPGADGRLRSEERRVGKGGNRERGTKTQE